MTDEQDCEYWWLGPFALLASIYVIAFALAVISNISHCTRAEWRRLDYVFPARQVGCWLGEVPRGGI